MIVNSLFYGLRKFLNLSDSISYYFWLDFWRSLCICTAYYSVTISETSLCSHVSSDWSFPGTFLHAFQLPQFSKHIICVSSTQKACFYLSILLCFLLFLQYNLEKAFWQKTRMLITRHKRVLSLCFFSFVLPTFQGLKRFVWYILSLFIVTLCDRARWS